MSEPHIFRVTLSRSRLVKYLGVILDSQLNWRKHVDVKVRMAHDMLWTCDAMWGLRHKVVHWLYVSVIQLSITFASLVWWPGCQTAGAKKTLSRIQRPACLGITGAICTTTGGLETLSGLPPLDLVIQGEARSAAHHLWSLGCWSYHHTSWGHSSILMQLQRSDPILNTGVDIMKPAFNLQRKYRVSMLTREEWTRGPLTPVVKGLVCFNDGSRTMEVTGAVLYRKSLGRRLRISLKKTCYSFCRLRYMLSWPVFIKFKWMLDQRNMLVLALIVRQLRRPFRLPTQHLHWYDNAKRCWMISLPNTQRHCTGFLDMLGCKETRSPTALQRTVFFRNLSDLSRPRGSLQRTLKR